MTLIVGIINEEGVVVASDAAATLGNLGNSTARQQTKKLSILQDQIIVGVSGPVGLGQMLTGAMDKIYTEGLLRSLKPYEAMNVISKKFREYIYEEFEAAQKAQTINGIGSTAAISAISFSLVALPVSGVPCLFQFNQQGAPEQSNGGLPFVAIGSGQQIADPFLAFIRRVLWKDKTPSFSEAVLASIWTIHHAIMTNPGGIGGPIEVMTLTKEKNGWVAKELSEEETKEHLESIAHMEEYISEFNKPTPEPIEDMPQIPKLQNNKSDK